MYDNRSPAYGTHLPVLTSIVRDMLRQYPDKMIVEFGAGRFSTPILANMTKNFVSFESDAEWFATLQASGLRCLVSLPPGISYLMMLSMLDLGQISVLFSDQEPHTSRRQVHDYLSQMEEWDGVLVVHDADLFPELSQQFKNYVVYKAHDTAVCSHMGNPDDYSHHADNRTDVSVRPDSTNREGSDA